jgi:hypothetical protein
MLGITHKNTLNRRLFRGSQDNYGGVQPVDAVNMPDVWDVSALPSFEVSDIGDGEITEGMVAPSLQGWVNTMTFTASDNNTVAWSAGSIKLSNGTTYSIDAGNTGNMTTLTYVYFNMSTSTTTLQTTTNSATAIGTNKILVAVAANVTDTSNKATFQCFGGEGVNVLVVSDNIAADSINSNHVGSNTLVTNQANIASAVIVNSHISNLSADKINAGTLTGRTVIVKGTGSGTDIKLDSTDGIMEFYDGSSRKGFMRCSTGGDIQLNADDAMILKYNDGGGTDSFAIFDNSSIAFMLDSSRNGYFDGGDLHVDGVVYADGYNDVAEYFESSEKYSNRKLPVGTSVVLIGDRVRPAKKTEVPFGVVSYTAGFILGSMRRWPGKYVRDDYGRYKKNSKGHRVIAKEFDETREYVPRSKRPEWNPIGVFGQVRVRKGQPVAPHWKKMKSITDKIDLYFIFQKDDNQ